MIKEKDSPIGPIGKPWRAFGLQEQLGSDESQFTKDIHLEEFRVVVHVDTIEFGKHLTTAPRRIDALSVYHGTAVVDIYFVNHLHFFVF